MLQELLALDIYRVAMVFARMSGAFIMLPGFAASYLPVRVRLFIALGVSMVLVPLLAPNLPQQPQTVGGIFQHLAYELTIGAFIGALAQTLLAALHFAGSVVGLTAGLANAFVFDPVSESQGAMVTGFFNLIALVLIFVTGTHILMLQAVADSFAVFPPAGTLPTGDMANYLANTLARSFSIGLRLAAPFVVFSIVFQTAMGVTARLMPQMNVFFVALPAQILLALGLMMLVLPTVMLWLMHHFEGGIRAFTAGG